MKFLNRSIFDKIILVFLAITIVAFSSLLFYTVSSTRSSLEEERTEVLTKEAFLISEQTIVMYMNNLYDLDTLQMNLDYYSESLDASIWFFDAKGIKVAASKAAGHPDCPASIKLLDYDFELEAMQTFSGKFYDLFTDEVITVAIPIKTNEKPSGMVMLHSTVSQLHELQKRVVNNLYVPFLLFVIIGFGFIGIVSRKVLRPVRKIVDAAEEYSKGNFEVKTGVNQKDEIGQLASSLEYMASELQKLDDYRKAFISNISHDFRSPLTSIKGYAEAMIDGTIPPEKQDRYLSIIVDETKRLSKLTSSLLELNDFDSYGIWLMPKAFDVIDLVKGAINTYEGRCIEKGVSIILNNHAKDTVVYADKMKIQQVIYNLLDNAFKFTPAGKKIYFTLVDKGDKIFISVKDEGMGISRDDIKKIWTRFYKTDASRGKDKNGTGLGLSITKEIIKAHKENIDVVSTEGVGSEFTFTLTKAEAMGKKQTDITDILTADKKGK